MLTLAQLGLQVATRRKALGLRQSDLMQRARISRATLNRLENGRIGELGFTKITNLLSALGLELKLQEVSSARPTLDHLLQEDRDDG